jgi:hypothetical protein
MYKYICFMVRAGTTVFRVINFSSDMLFGLVYKDERSWKGSTAAGGKVELVSGGPAAHRHVEAARN